ncbi:MAG: RNA polymerase sigma factor [Bacteroidetes bacterium]|nr:MAG: RNA polymerase sigma factor [Bacteroidota bacterium]
MTIENEEALLQAIQDDSRRFGEVYDAYYGDIFRYAFRRTAQYDAARDIAAETFLKAFAGIGRFRWRGVSILHWLYRIATNELRRYATARAYAPSSLNRIMEEYGVDIAGSGGAEEERIAAEEELAKHEEYRRVHGVIGTLDAKYQEVLALRYYERRSVAEIALILGKREGTVKSLLSRGIEQVRKRIKG